MKDLLNAISDVTIARHEKINEEIEEKLISLQKTLLSDYKGLPNNALFYLGELKKLIEFKGENPNEDGRYIIMTRLLKFRHGIDRVPSGKQIKF